VGLVNLLAIFLGARLPFALDFFGLFVIFMSILALSSFSRETMKRGRLLYSTGGDVAVAL